MRVVVVGAGAWGLPAAAGLARRGHQVDLVDGHGVGNALASSGGASRIWRLAHPHRHGVRLALRSVEAWERLESRVGRPVRLELGLLWRGPDASEVAQALAAEGVVAEWVAPKDVGDYLPTLRPNGVPAVWQRQAGPVLASVALSAQLEIFERSGGRLHPGRWVDRVEVDRDGVGVALRDTAAADTLDLVGDVVVLAPGPWAAPLLATVGVELELSPVLEQVGYFDGPAGCEGWPSIIDTDGVGLGVYGMATPGMGYKLGKDEHPRGLDPWAENREADPDEVGRLESWVADHLLGLVPQVRELQVCTWTNSADGWFVVDRIHEGQVVYACGDSGQGFKFSALMGELLADLAEGAEPDADVAALAPARFPIVSDR